MWNRKSVAMMMALSTVLCFSGMTAASERKQTPKNPVVLMKTSLGDIKIELWQDRAPVTTGNFLRYVEERFYDGTIFHRVIRGFVIQGGGFTASFERKPTHEPIPNEASSGLPNKRGTIAMARTREIHSATSQFFINLADNAFLNHKNETPQGYGYAVFGTVIEGMDVVDRIAMVVTTSMGPYRDVPKTPVIVTSLRRIQTADAKDVPGGTGSGRSQSK